MFGYREGGPPALSRTESMGHPNADARRAKKKEETKAPGAKPAPGRYPIRRCNWNRQPNLISNESAPLLCYEGFYGAGHPIACATGVDRVNFVIVGGLRPEVVDAHAEQRIGMAPVQPNVRFCRLAQVFWIRTIVH